MSEDLGVGLGPEPDAFGLELRLQRPHVLDDSIVDDRNALECIHVGMGVLQRDTAVGGPTGVRDARRACEVSRHGSGQPRDPAHGAMNLQLPVVVNRQPC